jgi:hypothetical protein
MKLLVDAAKKGMKCYKVVKEITKIFLKWIFGDMAKNEIE